MKQLIKESLCLDVIEKENLKVSALNYGMVEFKRLSNSIYYDGFLYDDINDKQITKTLSIVDRYRIDIGVEHQNDFSLINQVDDKEKFHALRIAKLVKEIKAGNSICPVHFDSFAYHYPSRIQDGHHRIRALQYLGYKFFPAFLSGLCAEIQSELNPVYFCHEDSDYIYP